jgi:cytidine deaminase
MQNDHSQKEVLWNKAREAREKAYAPYSLFLVGAALETENGKFYLGCNVENASYGATICAERVAILKAVSEGSLKIKRVAIVADSKGQSVPPCGMCLQVMAEFCEANTEIILGTPQKIEKVLKFADLLPAAFSKSFLK